MEEEIFEKVKKIIEEGLETESEKITMNATFTDDLGADSLDIVELIMSIEDEFGIEVPDNAAEKISTVGDVVKYIEGLKQ